MITTKTPRIENWSVATRLGDPYTPPEARSAVLYGEVYNHPRIMDGGRVSTSTVLDLDLGARMARTKNTVYELGRPAKDYADTYRESFEAAGWQVAA